MINDLRSLGETALRKEQGRVIEEETQRAFDLNTGPLFRCRLVKLKEQEHILLLNTHHIISDGWSAEVIERDLGELHSATISSREAKLPTLPIQYADYPEWQRDWLTGDVLEQQMVYWRERLRDLPALNLPTDFVWPTYHSYCSASIECEISSIVSEQLRKLVQRNQTTSFVTLLAAF